MKKLTCLLLALLLCTAAGCGHTVPAATAAPTGPTEPPVQEIPYESQPDARPYVGVTLKYATTLDGEEPAAAVLLQAAQVFTRQTGAQVEINWLGTGEAAFIEGQADIYELSGQALTAGSANAYDLTKLDAAADFGTHSYTFLRRQITDRCGFLAGIPAVPHIRGLYYSRDAFEDCEIGTTPKSWDEFLNLCQMLARGGYLPLALDNAYAPEAAWLYFAGAGFSWEDGAQALIDFLAAGYLTPGSPSEYPAGQNKLALSNVAMVFGPDALCAEVSETALADMDYGVLPWPGGGAAVDSDVLAVHKNTANAQAAFDFIRLLTSGEFDQLRADVTGTIPADPANASSIVGAEAILSAAQAETPAMPAELEGVLLKLWQGKYQSGKSFAAALTAKLPPEPAISEPAAP